MFSSPEEEGRVVLGASAAMPLLQQQTFQFIHLRRYPLEDIGADSNTSNASNPFHQLLNEDAKRGREKTVRKVVVEA